MAVDYGRGQCWLYLGKTTIGASKNYARKWFHGQWTGAHRIALAIKLDSTLWDLEGYDAAHAQKRVGIGGRCCNPAHLFPKESEPNRSWERAKDAAVFGSTVGSPILVRFYPQAITLIDPAVRGRHGGLQR